MKQLINIILTLIPFLTYSQPDTTNVIKTATFAGDYSYGDDIEEERVGSVLVYPESDSTILFYLDLNRGAPSYNMGQLYGRLQLKGNEGEFYTHFDYAEAGCRIYFQFTEQQLTLTTMDDASECGFGYGVYADGIFERKTHEKPVSFRDATGEIHYFEEHE